jgi:catechol 2,3-dioxygenase-like lactoylglutathione lyase family enzyme
MGTVDLRCCLADRAELPLTAGDGYSGAPQGHATPHLFVSPLSIKLSVRTTCIAWDHNRGVAEEPPLLPPVGHVAFEVDDLQAAVDRLAADGYGLVGGIGQYEHIWRMAYVRGPEGIIVSLAQRIG